MRRARWTCDANAALPPRTILYTGKGGVGKTSVAAATARRCAASGLRTLVVSTDPAHSLADALQTPLGPDPQAVADRLDAQQVSAQAELDRNWAGVSRWLSRVLIERGMDRISAQELSVPPGLDELFSLLQLKTHVEAGLYDVIVVDCAPTGETLRLLSFPDVARWWLQRVFHQQSRLLDAARPFARAVLDIPLPGDEVLAEVNGLVRNLVAMNEILRDTEHVSVRLVMTPDKMVVDEARRTFTYLNLYGFLTDAVVCNRVFPSGVGDYFATWRDLQQEQLAAVRSGFSPVPVLEAPFFGGEIVGPDRLDELGDALFGEVEAHGVLHSAITQTLVMGEDGADLRLDLPFAARGEVSVKKIGAELVVGVDGHRRTILLPDALGALRPAGARLEDGKLHVAFTTADA